MDPNEIKVPSDVGWGTFAAGVGFVFAWLGKLELKNRGQRAMLKQIIEHLNKQDARSSKWRTDFNISLNQVRAKMTDLDKKAAVLEAIKEERDKVIKGN